MSEKISRAYVQEMTEGKLQSFSNIYILVHKYSKSFEVSLSNLESYCNATLHAYVGYLSERRIVLKRQGASVKKATLRGLYIPREIAPGQAQPPGSILLFYRHCFLSFMLQSPSLAAECAASAAVHALRIFAFAFLRREFFMGAASALGHDRENGNVYIQKGLYVFPAAAL